MLPHRRELQTYPTGARRRGLLAAAILAMFLTAYEGQIAPVLSLLLADLGMPLGRYGVITAVSLLVGAVAGFVGGKLVDRLGRVRLMVPFLFLSGLACLFMATATTEAQFTTARVVLALVEGIAAAGSAPLVRDFAPRMGRAQAFAFFSWGTVGANFFAAALTALTLDLLGGTWQAQLHLMAGISLAGAVVVAATLRELAPPVRREIRLSEESVRSITPTRTDSPVRNATAWTYVAAMSALFLLLGTLNAYGQVLLGEALGVPVRLASLIMMLFWGANLVASLGFSRWSDRLQRRTPFLLAGGTTSGAALLALIVLLGLGTGAPAAVVAVAFIALGVALGAVFGPWMAAFAAYVEETHVDAEGTAFGLQHLVSRLVVLGAVLLAPRFAEAAGWSAWLLVTLAAVVVFLALIVFLHRRNPERAPEAVPESAVAG
ncbi:MFS transporter [Saccharopolyspora flava]|uniref:Sugar phosphate permease n=1 Tax=Saccharopolyspora flava TaxID=95161 RepID=A0A1I6U6H6_9PSEU|nr:MFS transporter [Saccharopolyspora flava]SFS97046.1 Sugar phosphate permease [Saccharopolyspora flava]